MRAILLDDAQRDFEEIYDYLENVTPGAGRKLYRELQKVIDRIEYFPRSYALAYKQFRLATVRRFKYGVYYHVGRKYVFIHAIIDLRRDPRQILRILRSR